MMQQNLIMSFTQSNYTINQVYNGLNSYDGGRQAFGKIWPSDLKNRIMVTKTNHLFPPS